MFEAAKAFVIRAGGAGLAFALQAMLARLMPVSEYGLFVMVWVWTLALGSFASLGLAEMALRVLPRYALRMRNGLVAEFVSHGFRTTAAIALFSSLAVALLVRELPLSTEMLRVVHGVCLTLPLLALDFFLGGVSRAMGWFTLGIVTAYVVRPVLVMAGCLLLWGTGFTLTGTAVTFTFAACLLATTLFLRIVIQRRLGSDLAAPTSPTLRRFWLKQSMPMLLASGLDDVLGYADVVIVGLLLSPAEAAIYFVASRVLVPAGLVQYAFFYVAARRFSLALASDERQDMSKRFWRATLATVLACAAAVIITILAAPFLLKVFGGEFETALPLVLVLGLAQIARAAATQPQEYLLVAGRAMDVTWANGISAAAMIAGAIFAAPQFGVIGVAWVLAAALAFRALLLLRQAGVHTARPVATT